MYKLTLPQSQAPLLNVHNHWIGQVALHDKQRAENHLKEQESVIEYHQWGNATVDIVKGQDENLESPDDTHHSLLHVSVWFKSDECTPHIEQATTGARHLHGKKHCI